LFRHDTGIVVNTLPLVDEMEVLEALALELLVIVAFVTESVIVAFLADSEVVIAFLAESVVDEQSNMGAHFVAHCFNVMCIGLLLIHILQNWSSLFLSLYSES